MAQIAGPQDRELPEFYASERIRGRKDYTGSEFGRNGARASKRGPARARAARMAASHARVDKRFPSGAHMDKSGLKTHNIMGAAQEPGPVWMRAARKTQTGSLKAIMTFGRLKFRWGRLDAVHACTSRPPWKAEPPERLAKDDQKPAACCTWEERGCHEPLAPHCSK